MSFSNGYVIDLAVRITNILVDQQKSNLMAGDKEDHAHWLLIARGHLHFRDCMVRAWGVLAPSILCSVAINGTIALFFLCLAMQAVSAGRVLGACLWAAVTALTIGLLALRLQPVAQVTTTCRILTHQCAVFGAEVQSDHAGLAHLRCLHFFETYSVGATLPGFGLVTEEGIAGAVRIVAMALPATLASMQAYMGSIVNMGANLTAV